MLHSVIPFITQRHCFPLLNFHIKNAAHLSEKQYEIKRNSTFQRLSYDTPYIYIRKDKTLLNTTVTCVELFLLYALCSDYPIFECERHIYVYICRTQISVYFDDVYRETFWLVKLLLYKLYLFQTRM